MAKYNNILEGSSGKVGKVITYQMYGKSYLRSMPGYYTDKKSLRQLAQRQKMQLINTFLGPFKDVLKITYKSLAVGRSAYQAAKSYNLLNGIRGEYPEQLIDYSKALISVGDVPLPDLISFKHTDEGILVNWKDDEKGNLTDTLMLVANMRGQYNTVYKHTGAERREGVCLWKQDFRGRDVYDIWVIFRDCKERAYSNSLYLGAIG